MRHTVVLHHAHPARISPHARTRRAVGRLVYAADGLLLILRGSLSVIHHGLRLLAGLLLLVRSVLLLLVEVGVMWRLLLVLVLLERIMRGRLLVWRL
jgi:hypothetical protein